MENRKEVAALAMMFYQNRNKVFEQSPIKISRSQSFGFLEVTDRIILLDDWSPTGFHCWEIAFTNLALNVLQLCCDLSATDQRYIGDWSATYWSFAGRFQACAD